MIDVVRRAVARRLEHRGEGLHPLLRPVHAALARALGRGLRRPLALPDGVRVIGVGGATVGGSGKTPFAMALAGALSARGERVALVGHAYRARPGRPRIVTSRDGLREVGDEALEALSAGVPVVVGPTRQAAVDRAAREARTIVLDGLLQARPAKVALSILVVDAREPWGSGLVLPFGDLRAPVADLVAAADVCVALVDTLEKPGPALRLPIPVVPIPTTLDAPAEGRIGLVLAMARPNRVLRALELRGIEPVSVELLADHALPGPRLVDRLAQRDVDVWLTTRKTRPLLPDTVGGAPVRVARLTLELDARLLDRVYAPAGAS